MNSSDPYNSFVHTLIMAVIILAVATALGLVTHQARLRTVWTGEAQTQAPKTTSPPVTEDGAPPATQPSTGLMPTEVPVPVELNEVQEMVQLGALLIDARSREDYLEGHLPGARSLPLGEADDLLETFLREVPKDIPLIAYCSGYDCPDSFTLGERLLAEGYREVMVFEGGVPQWRDTGLPLEEGGG